MGGYNRGMEKKRGINIRERIEREFSGIELINDTVEKLVVIGVVDLVFLIIAIVTSIFWNTSTIFIVVCILINIIILGPLYTNKYTIGQELNKYIIEIERESREADKLLKLINKYETEYYIIEKKELGNEISEILGNTSWVNDIELLKNDIKELKSRLKTFAEYIHNAQRYVQKKKYDKEKMEDIAVCIEEYINNNRNTISIKGLMEDTNR